MSFCFLNYQVRPQDEDSFILSLSPDVHTGTRLVGTTTTDMHRKAKMHEKKKTQTNSGPVSHGSLHTPMVLSEIQINIYSCAIYDDVKALR